MMRMAITVCGLCFCTASFIPAQTAPVAPSNPSHLPVHPQRVMAPPMETRVATRLRPSTAEAGTSRTAKPPLQILPLLSGISTADHHGHWLILYRAEHCVPCDRLMNVLAASNSADLRSGMPYTIIVEGATTAVSSVRASYSTLGAANWLSDTNRSAFTSLKLKGTPELIALDGNRIVWKVSGNLGAPQQVLHIADAWIAGTAAADAEAHAKLSTSTKDRDGKTPSTASVKR